MIFMRLVHVDNDSCHSKSLYIYSSSSVGDKAIVDKSLDGVKNNAFALSYRTLDLLYDEEHYDCILRRTFNLSYYKEHLVVLS